MAIEEDCLVDGPDLVREHFLELLTSRIISQGLWSNLDDHFRRLVKYTPSDQ